MTPQILHLDMDAFFVSVEQTLDPSLKGKPVIVGGNPEGRGVVAAASYEARAYGIHSAMPVFRAKKLCPEAIFLRGNYTKYAEASALVFEILRHYSPLVEPVSIDEAYLDLTGLNRLFGPSMDIAVKIRRNIEDKLGLKSSAALASNKLISKVASDFAKPSGIADILPGYERRFLAPLPLGKLPGIGPRTLERLQQFNLRTIGALASIPPKLLEISFGKVGLLLHERANGLDDRRVVAEARAAKSIGKETTLEEDTIDLEYLEATLHYLTEKIAKTAREEGTEARTVTLKLRYADFTTFTRSYTFPIPTDLECEIFPVVVSLFRKLYTRRLKIRLLGISLSNFQRGTQLNLFREEQDSKLRNLYCGIDRIREKYGFKALVWGKTIPYLEARN